MSAPQDMEILAPAGGPAALDAALEAGADAVYLGLLLLNARRGAANFAPESLVDTVAQVHARGARAYLTLNVDISQRELGQAARHLELARLARVDAILVRDPALLALRSLYPELTFHFSTQAGISSSAGMRAAAGFGVKRVVLAREMALAEVKAAAAVTAVETEVFVQGALCFCVSGRCLLSSWLGGRSGNRGACASPCRFAWAAEGGSGGRPLSMHDLSLLERLSALREAGVRTLKIEGRLKKPEWVAAAVSLYRRALSGEPVDSLREALRHLGDYTGRQLTSGYLDGLRSGLTGESGRLAPGTPATAHEARQEPEPEAAALRENEFSLGVQVADGTLLWTVACRGQAGELRSPLSRVHHADRALTLGAAGARLGAAPIQGFTLARYVAASPEQLVPRNAINQVEHYLSTFLHRARKAPDGTVRIELPEAVRLALRPAAPHAANGRALGSVPDRVRIEAARAAAFRRDSPMVTLIIEGAAAADITGLASLPGTCPPVIALPAVFYEEAIPAIQPLLAACRAANLVVEVNSWDGWQLARECGVRLEAGPGLAVLNALAAKFLLDHGCECVTLALEADREQLADVCAACAVPLSLYVYGRPPLLVSRAEVPGVEGTTGTRFADARGISMRARREAGLTVFRPETPFAIADLRDATIRVAHLVVDLIAAPEPQAEFRACTHPQATPNRFNFDRTLK